MTKEIETKGRADSIDKLVSKRLKMRRVMLGLSQNDLGKAVDVSIQQVQKYEKATNRISSGKLFAFAKFLKVPINYFYDKVDNTNGIANSVFAEEASVYEANTQDHTSEKEVLTLVKAFTDIKNPQSRKKVIELIKTMT